MSKQKNARPIRFRAAISPPMRQPRVAVTMAVAFLLGSVGGTASAALTLTIDDFSAFQDLTANSGSATTCSSVDDASIFGGERDACAIWVSGNNVELEIGNGSASYRHSQNTGTLGSTQAVWDGNDNAPLPGDIGNSLDLDLSGCAPADQRFEVGIIVSDPGTGVGGGENADLELTVYDNATAYTKEVALTTGGPYAVDFPFTDFAPFNFETTTVTALRLRVLGNDVGQAAADVEVGYVRTCEPPPPPPPPPPVPAIGPIGAAGLAVGLSTLGLVFGFRRRR